VPMTDQPAGVRVHVCPNGERLKRRGKCIETGTEIGHQDLRPTKASRPEPEFLEREPRRWTCATFGNMTPIGTGVFDLEGALQEPRVQLRTLLRTLGRPIGQDSLLKCGDG